MFFFFSSILIPCVFPFTFSVIFERYGFRVIVLLVGFMLEVVSLVLCGPLPHFTYPLRISCRAGLVVMYSFILFVCFFVSLFGKTFISPSILSDRLFWIKDSWLHSFSVHHIADFLPFLSGLPSFSRQISHEFYRSVFIC